MNEDDTHELAQALVTAYARAGRKIATAESCTGGSIAAAITDIAGSSTVFDRGFVTYSNEAKRDLLGVRETTLAEYGAVSSEAAAEMADGALRRSASDVAIAVTGIAGPGGGSPEKPVGLVWLGIAEAGQPPRTRRLQFDPAEGRSVIRSGAVAAAIAWLMEALDDQETA